MELVGLNRAGKVAPGAKWRVTWGVSWQGDVLEFFSPANWDAARLQDAAWKMVNALPALGLHIYSVTPPAVDSDADAFTLDIAFSSSSSTSDITVELALQKLEGVLTSFTLARVAAIGAAETPAQAQKAREAATTGAKDTTGVTAGLDLADAAGDAAGKVGSWMKTAAIIAAVVGGLVVLTWAKNGGQLPLVGELLPKATKAPRAGRSAKRGGSK